ncbi:MAG: LemA family protein [Lachnospiraceae bacterium]|nr:LemA family protein [Lachnospiraceae bacterium]
MQFGEIAPILLLLLIAIGGIAIYSYSNLMKLYNNVRESYTILDMYFRRRWDVITSFMSYIEHYIDKENEAYKELAELHTGIFDALSRTRKFTINSKLSSNLKEIISQCNDNSELKEKEEFKLQCKEINRVEEKIAEYRGKYNIAVLTFDAKIETFPNYIIGGMMKISDYEQCS